MNKPIIIDGVDVSECKEIRNYDYLLIVCGITGMKCQLNTNCLYKQLKRLKAENEGLKAFKRECLKPVYFPDIEPEVINKYKQALEEVREIINFRFKTPYMKLGLKETDKIIEDIEKIVNEVLKDENH